MSKRNGAKGKRWNNYDNEEGQAAIIYMYVVGTVMLLAIYIYMTPIMDYLTAFHINMTQGAGALFPVSQNTEDSIFITQLAFRNWPLIVWIGLTVVCYEAALRMRSGQA